MYAFEISRLQRRPANLLEWIGGALFCHTFRCIFHLEPMAPFTRTLLTKFQPRIQLLLLPPICDVVHFLSHFHANKAIKKCFCAIYFWSLLITFWLYIFQHIASWQTDSILIEISNSKRIILSSRLRLQHKGTADTHFPSSFALFF